MNVKDLIKILKEASEDAFIYVDDNKSSICVVDKAKIDEDGDIILGFY